MHRYVCLGLGAKDCGVVTMEVEKGRFFHLLWEQGSLLLVNNLIFLQKQDNSQMSFRGQFQHLIVSLLTFLLMNVNRAVDKSFVFLECSL